MTTEQALRATTYRPFGPLILSAEIERPFVEMLNDYSDRLLADQALLRSNDASANLVGNVENEFLVPDEQWTQAVSPGGSNLLSWMSAFADGYVRMAVNSPTLKEIRVQSAWVVSQRAGDFNRVHNHTGDLSGIIYLKMPRSIVNDEEQKPAGWIDFIDGRRHAFCENSMLAKPVVGAVYMFPSWLCHTVYPFRGEGERRSMAFNLTLTR